jgi:hypothetical protein
MHMNHQIAEYPEQTGKLLSTLDKARSRLIAEADATLCETIDTVYRAAVFAQWGARADAKNDPAAELENPF